MPSQLIRFIFFANYFIGLLAIALSVETVVQLKLPYNSGLYYLLLFCATVFYYTYAYTISPSTTVLQNPRTAWYTRYRPFIKKSQFVLQAICVVSAVMIIVQNFQNLIRLPLIYWSILFIIGLSALLYYGLLPGSSIKLNLRNTGWIKAFVIGFVWACCVSLLPLVFLKIQRGHQTAEALLAGWLFLKNWMFCTVNAIMFDMKDYADDANEELKTFVVRIGLRKTIFYILIPLLMIGILSLTIFAWIRNFAIVNYLFNLLPFVLLLLVAYSLHRRRTILFYLIVIDGLLLIKACCGITGMYFQLSH